MDLQNWSCESESSFILQQSEKGDAEITL